MRVAFSEAMKRGFDAYLLLNDDTRLLPDAIGIMLRSENYAIKVTGSPALIVGSVVDPTTGQLTYGGRVSRGWRQPLYYDFVPHQAAPVVCDTANANCLLIPSEIAIKIGNLDPVFAHGKADFDYGLRVGRAGYSVLVANAIVGDCSQNQPENKLRFKKMTLVQRWRYLMSPKQYPLFEWLVYTKRHAGPFWIIHWLRPYRRLFFP